MFLRDRPQAQLLLPLLVPLMAPALAKSRVPIIPFHKKGCQEKCLLHDGRTQRKRAPLFPLPLLPSLQIFPCRSVLDAARAKQLKREIYPGDRSGPQAQEAHP